MADSTPSTIRVALPVFPGISAATVMGFYDVLTCAGRAWQAMTGDDAPQTLFEPVIVGKSRGVAPCANGAKLHVEVDFAAAGDFDVVILSSILAPPPEISKCLHPELKSWITSCRERGAVLASVCSGSIALAEAGLLNGLEATTHWSYAGHFRQTYPDVRLQPERLLIECPVQPAIVTAGGGSSWHDLALRLVERFIDAETAAQTARVFLMHWHEDQQTVFACLTPELSATDGAVAHSQRVMREHFSSASALEMAARSSGLSERTYQRRFRLATGMTPTQHLQLLRIEKAKELLQASPMPVTDIGWEVGYEDSTSFRRVFKKLNGIGPGEYRKRFLRPG